MSCNCGQKAVKKERPKQVVKPVVRNIKQVPSVTRVIRRPAR